MAYTILATPEFEKDYGKPVSTYKKGVLGYGHGLPLTLLKPGFPI
jgi:hypothetical protein